MNDDLFIGVIMTGADVAVDNPQNLTLNIYPNPSHNMIIIKKHEKIRKLRIMDILGQVVHFSQPQSEQFQIDISELREGVYFVQILTNEGYTVQKIQIAR